MPELTQVVLTDDQALQVSQAISLALENSVEEQIGENEDSLKQLSVFFGLVAAHPERFPVSGRLAKAIKTAKRSAPKGPAQPQSRRNKRKARQEKRQGFAKRRRKQRREDAENLNAAREAIERDMAEMQEAFEAQQARGLELMAAEKLTGSELAELLSIAGAPPEIIEAAGKLAPEEPKLILPGQ